MIYVTNLDNNTCPGRIFAHQSCDINAWYNCQRLNRIHKTSHRESDVTSMWVLCQMSAVAAHEFGIRGAKRASMSDDHQLYLTLVDVDQHRGTPLCVHQEDNGEYRHLKLRAGANEGTRDRLDHTVPAELEVQDMVVLVRLETRDLDKVLQWKIRLFRHLAQSTY